MKLWQMAVGVLLFAAAAALLYVWGLKKSLSQQEELPRNLLHACGSRVMKYLKKHDTITAEQIARLIQGVKVQQVWSRRSLTVQNGREFAPKLIQFLLDQQYIRPVGKDTYERRP